MGTNQEVSQSKWMVTFSNLQEKQNCMKDMNNISSTRLIPCKTFIKIYKLDKKVMINLKNIKKVA